MRILTLLTISAISLAASAAPAAAQDKGDAMNHNRSSHGSM